ncbi:MAG: cation:proton antiporter [Burkholderiaceae bacterium]|nr:cation:proton antiporter [Burkholderiaceae bacterium]
MLANSFAEIAALLALAAGVGALALQLRQPLIVAFIFVGLLAGPSALGWVKAHDEIDLLAQLGVAVLLFVVGLKLDLKLVRHLGPVALATGIGQVAVHHRVRLPDRLLLGMSGIKALYVAVALTFSSTIIIVKLLSDKREIDSLHGRIAVGFLIVQDIVVVLAMMAYVCASAAPAARSRRCALRADARWLARGRRAAAGGPADALPAAAAAGAAGALAGATAAVRYRLGRAAGGSRRVLRLFARGWRVPGRLLARLHALPRGAVDAPDHGLRDFLLLFFFIDLGAKLDLATLGSEFGAAIVFSAFVLIGNPLIVMIIMGVMGYRKRTGFLAGLTVAQVSEFSIVFVAMGISLGHVASDALGLVTLVGLITITTSTYMILYSEPLYRRLEPWLGVFERANPLRERDGAHAGGDSVPDVIVFGLGRYGSRLLDDLHQRGVRVTGFDFDPEVVRGLQARGIDARFGDAEDLHLLETLPLARIRWIVSTLPQPEINAALLQTLGSLGYGGASAATVHRDEDAAVMAAAGATHVLHPYRNAADFAAELVGAALSQPAVPPASVLLGRVNTI